MIEDNELLYTEALQEETIARRMALPLEFGTTYHRYEMRLDSVERDYIQFRHITPPVYYQALGDGPHMLVQTAVDAFSLDKKNDLERSPVSALYHANSMYYPKREVLDALEGKGFVPFPVLPMSVSAGFMRRENMWHLQDVVHQCMRKNKRIKDPFFYTTMHGYTLHEQGAEGVLDAAAIPSEACVAVKYRGKRVLVQFNSFMHPSMTNTDVSPFMKAHMTNNRFIQYFASGIADAIVFQTVPLNAQTSLTHKLFTSRLFAHFEPVPVNGGSRTLYGICANSAMRELQQDRGFMEMVLAISNLWEENFSESMEAYKRGIAPVNSDDKNECRHVALARLHSFFMRHAALSQQHAPGVTHYDIWEEQAADPVETPSVRMMTGGLWDLISTHPHFWKAPLRHAA